MKRYFIVITTFVFLSLVTITIAGFSNQSNQSYLPLGDNSNDLEDFSESN